MSTDHGQGAVSTPGSLVDPRARIGADVQIGARVHIRESASIGDGCRIGDGAYVDKGVSIGARCCIGAQVSVYQGVSLAARVTVGAHAVFTNDRYPRAFASQWEVVPTRVGEGAWIGANSTIVCGVNIGEYAVVDPGSVVTRDIAPGVRVGGNPAHPVVAMAERRP